VSGIAEQFRSASQQEEAATLGMWVFLATEVLFFGVLFFVYSLMRMRFSADFAAASRHTDVLLGTLNTAVLLSSSLTMALAVRGRQLRLLRPTRGWLLTTAALGSLFLIVKGLEYYQDYTEHLVPTLSFDFDPAHARGAEIFFSLYFVMTGIHALHLLIGIALVLLLARDLPGLLPHERPGDTTIEVGGLYWHFVDIVWIFLYPLLYLVSRS
jgi:cytochrome c oxidase subunit 3